MTSRMQRIINKLNLNAGASVMDLEEVQRRLGLVLPKEYTDFLLTSDGAEGSIGESYLRLWPVKQLEKLNKMYSVHEFAPGLLLFGTDGADMAFAFDTRTADMIVVEVPFIDMSLKELGFCSRTFSGFLEYLYDHK